MTDPKSDKLREHIVAALDRRIGLQHEGDCFFADIYADYRDEMDNTTAVKILTSRDPLECFAEQLAAWYDDYAFHLRSELAEEVQTELTAADGPYPMGFTEEESGLFDDLIMDMVMFRFPEDHYLNQSFHVNIMVDTGDGNYDYVLNSVYPSWYGTCGEQIDPKAGIVWLAKTQGYTRGQLRQALQKEDTTHLNGFLQSMRVELANIASHMNTVTFLVELSLKDLMELNRLIQLQDRNGHFYDSRKNPYCGYIILEKSTMTGLYDPWQGGGSVFEIQLERDVKLPIKYIRSALPDGGDGYAIEAVYGMCGSAWTQGGVKQIHAPLKFSA